MICGTCDIGQRNKEQALVWIGFLVIQTKKELELFAESLAPTNSGKNIDATQIQSLTWVCQFSVFWSYGVFLLRFSRRKFRNYDHPSAAMKSRGGKTRTRDEGFHEEVG